MSSIPGHVRTGPDVRMNVKVSRRDFPLLAEEIARLPKGPRRTNRLAHLATLGLCWERAVGAVGAVPCDLMAPPNGAVSSDSSTRAYRSRLDAGQLAALLNGDAGA